MKGIARFCKRGRMVAWVLLPACMAVSVGAQEPAKGGRRPQWPLKSSRTLLTDEQIARARRLCQTNAGAIALREAIEKDAAYWVAKSDEQLHDLLPDARVPRAFNVSTEGCPVHGKAIYASGTYPWKLDRERPFTIICPVGGEHYPSNDFEAYYRSGMKDESLLTGPFSDPGRGWVSPSGEKYWLVGYACHWNWMTTWLPAVTTLSQAYVLTGKTVYARKAIVMLDRIAEIYPGMDYSKQSRYAERMNGRYYGKILNRIWETDVLERLSKAYDGVFDALVGETPVSLPWRTADQIRANIEANLLEEGIDAVGRGQIIGNFGMHQSALAHAVVVRQNGPTEKLLDGIFTTSGKGLRHEGLNYALHNLVYKDGMPYESSPGYCFGWVGHFVTMGQALSLAGMDLYERPKMSLMFDAPLAMVCTGKFTPAIGDAGSITAGWVGPTPAVYEQAYRRFRKPAYAWALDYLGALKDAPTKNIEERGDLLERTDTRQQALEIVRVETYEDLFKESIVERARADAKQYRHRPRSRLLDGYGLAVLNNRNDSVAVAMYYGVRGGHGHYDRLNIELFGHGRRLTPDLGYPDFMNAFCPGIFSWSKNTISHNCLAIDRTGQRGNLAGQVLRFHDSPTVHVVDVDAAGSYGQAEVYRRTLVLVDVSEDDSYLVDVFRVQGGTEHVLSVHGQEGEFSLAGVSLPPPVTKGTLAGPDVAYGQLYDNPKMGQPGYKDGYGGYNGSGYQHFFNYQKVVPEETVVGTWKLAGDSEARLRVHVPPRPGQELIVADAYVSPTRKVPTVLKYMLLRRKSSATGQTFVTVWEPAGDSSLIDRIELFDSALLGSGHDRLVRLVVRRGETTDTIAITPQAGRRQSTGARLTSDAAVVVVSERDGRRTRTFAAGGTKLASRAPDEAVSIPATISGTVRAVDYAVKTLKADVGNDPSDVAALPGCRVRIFNEKHSCMYTIAGAQIDGAGYLTLHLSGSEVFTGRIRIESVDPDARSVLTSTYGPCPSNLTGMHLVTLDLEHGVPIAAVTKQTIQLDGKAPLAPFVGDAETGGGKDAWVTDFGVGDRVEIERFVYQTQ